MEQQKYCWGHTKRYNDFPTYFRKFVFGTGAEGFG
jgi:hypothetical protein